MVDSNVKLVEECSGHVVLEWVRWVSGPGESLGKFVRSTVIVPREQNGCRGIMAGHLQDNTPVTISFCSGFVFAARKLRWMATVTETQK